MKQRFLSWVLAFVMVIGLLPMAALADTNESASEPTPEAVLPTITISDNTIIATVGETSTNYSLYLGQLSDDGSFTTETVSQTIADPSVQTTITWYVLLLDDNNSEASQEVYSALWTACENSTTLIVYDNASCNMELQIDTDGYHKYVVTTIRGEIPNSRVLKINVGEAYTYAYANITIDESSSDGNLPSGDDTQQELPYYGFYSAPERSAENYLSSVTLTGSETDTSVWFICEESMADIADNIKIKANETYITPSNDSWVNEEKSILKISLPRDITSTSYELSVYNEDSKLRGIIINQPEQPLLMYRFMKDSRGTWTEYTSAPQPISSLNSMSIGLNGQTGIRFYYGTTSDYTLVSDAHLTSSDSTIASVSTETASDGESFYLIQGLKYAATTLIYSAKETEGTITASVSPMRGFFATQERTVASYLTSITWENLSPDESGNRILWFTGINGFGGDQSYLSVTVNGAPGTFNWVQRENTNIYDMEILLPDPKGISYEVAVMYTNSGNTHAYSTIFVECPGLMYRLMMNNNGTWTERTDNPQPISALSTMSVSLNGQTGIRFYYGTMSDYTHLTDAVLTSSDSSVASVSVATAADNESFYLIQGLKYASTTLSFSTSETECAITASVSPMQAFFSTQERTAASFLTSPVDPECLQQDEDGNRILWFTGANGFGGVSVTVNGETGTFEWVQRGNTSIYDMKILLPNSMGGSYEVAVQYTNNESTYKWAGLTILTENGILLEELPLYAFFGTQARDRNYYLPHVIWRNLRESDGDTNNDNRFIWLVGETGFTAEQKSKITVETSGVEVDVTGKEIPVQCAWFDRGDNTYDLRVAIPMPKMTYDVVVKLDGTVLQKVAVEYKTFGNTYTHEQSGLVIGFALQEAGVTTVTPSLLDMGNYKDERPYDNRKTTSIVAATRQTTGGTDAYTVDEVVTSTLQIKRLWLESVNGDASAFSLSPNEYQTVLTDVSNHSIPLYVRGGHIGTSKLCAEVTGKIGEEPFTITVSAILDVYFTATGVKTYRPNNDTVTALNAYLEELAQTVNPHVLDGTIYTIHLGNTTYTGTIVLPEEFQGNNIVHIYGSNNTAIQGGIDLNTACVEQIRNIHFTANDDGTNANGKTRALYGSGVRSLYNCTFYGYDIALDSSDGLINATGGNVFVNNEIAAFVDLDDVVPTKYDRNLHRGYWKNNTFINNGTAVQVLSLHRLVPTYHFRIYDSNFINNGTDIDAQCGGTLYMYRNYFGQYQKDKDGHRPHPGKHHADRHNGREHLRLDELLNARTETKLNGILEYTRAKVSTENETKVITNPRWLHPVKGWWSHNMLVNDTFFGPESASYSLMTLDAEPEYADILVADWESETVILNKESSTLTLDASAFTGTSEKEIGVVDEYEKTVGTWNFK